MNKIYIPIAILAVTLACNQLAAEIPANHNAASKWDGKSKKETDAIVTLRLPGEPDRILLNGDPATINIDRSQGIVKVLIPSDESGRSCENTFVVNFKDGTKGQLLANNCHGDEAFDIKPGEFIDKRLTKEDVDNPADDDLSGNSIAFEWSANGFIEMDSDLKWMGSGGEYPALTFAIPETDAFFWITECKNGEAWNYIQMYRDNDTIGTKDFLKFETDQSSLFGYEVDVAALPFGDGDGTSPTLLLKLPVGDQLYSDLAAGNWLYMQRGEDDNAIKRRMSLAGSAKAIRAFQSGCAAKKSSASRRGAVPALSSYAGKYPFDEIDGYAMLNHPAYIQGVTSVVTNIEHREWVLGEAVTGPIEFLNGKAIISACEPHNCGNRYWTVVIDQARNRTEVCFHDEAQSAARYIRYTTTGMSKMAATEACM